MKIRDVETAHWPHLEAPEDVNGMMEEFLNELGTRTPSETPHTGVREEL